ncbi:carbohydrate ABC transporter permease [Agromyces salentinus]|uniref:Sugar ABC transporter permease n=1 Tax=Agromyces salentinus TaxID=269421 RepID=A0ABP4YTW5_9MICO|nr:sugar ABC transporter permease [Agromyces salentinus]
MTTRTTAPPRQAAASDGTGQHRPSRTLKGERTAAAWMISPALVLFILFLIIPIVLAFGLAFTNTRLISPRPGEFVGLDNFAYLFTDPVFWASVRNTFAFALVVVPVQAGSALLLALLVNAKVRGTNFFRTVYFLPVVTSMVVVSLLWRFMYEKDGLINQFLGRVTGGAYDPIDWLNDPVWALPAIMFMSIWQGVAFHMVIWLAGLQTIPAELYEASEIDGANKLQQFRYVTWPGLRQTATLILVTITIASFSLFTQIAVMTQGGPLDSTTTVVYQAVRTGYQQLQTGLASAISLVFFAMVLVISGIQRYLTRERS